MFAVVPLGKLKILFDLDQSVIVKGSWEAIFRVTDEINSMKGGVEVYIT